MRRIAFYSYDEQGLGHVRRSIAIAHALSAAQPCSILLIAGTREAALFRLPRGTDTLALPAPSTDFNGARRRPSLGLDLAGTVRMRAHTLRSALAAYAPHVLVADRLPLGAHDELAQSLPILNATGTRIVLGMREVLDDPDAVAAEWRRSNALAVLRRHYHQIWVYGDPRVFDPAVEYALPDDIRSMVRYTGYLDRHAGRPRDAAAAARRRRDLGLPDGRLALCLVGSGEDGHRLADAFARAQLPAATTGVILTGPFMADHERASLVAVARARHDLRVLGFVPDGDTLIPLADDVVAMGGYNTTCEILACGARALVVPRAEPRREQLIRARRLHALGALDALVSDELSAGALSSWLAADEAPPRVARPIDLDGLRRLPELLDELLAPPGAGTNDGGPSAGHRRFRRTLKQHAALSRSASA